MHAQISALWIEESAARIQLLDFGIQVSGCRLVSGQMAEESKAVVVSKCLICWCLFQASRDVARSEMALWIITNS
jgi:hypothetical protein